VNRSFMLFIYSMSWKSVDKIKPANQRLKVSKKRTFEFIVKSVKILKRIFSTQNRYLNQDKWATTYNSEFYADFKSAHRFLFGRVFLEIYQFF
jgi:hypothetical protein